MIRERHPRDRGICHRYSTQIYVPKNAKFKIVEHPPGHQACSPGLDPNDPSSGSRHEDLVTPSPFTLDSENGETKGGGIHKFRKFATTTIIRSHTRESKQQIKGSTSLFSKKKPKEKTNS